MTKRILDAALLADFSEEKALVKVISETATNSIAVWGVKPGQFVPPHLHPDGQDTWIMLQGELSYLLGGSKTSLLKPGQVAVAQANEIHGALNKGSNNAVFVSIYSAALLAVQPVDEKLA